MKSKLILVTGGAGHVGSHIIENLVNDPQNKVISLDNYSNGSPNNHISGAEYRKGHTKDIDKLIPETPDVVYHLGEYARIAPSHTEPEKVHDMNTIGTFSVVEFCRNRKVGKLVYAASSTKFATQGEGRNESPYAFSKAVNVDLINNYGRWYNLHYVICYFYNAFGPRENGVGQYANTKGYSILEIANAFGGPIVLTDGKPGRMESGEAPTKARSELGWETTVDILDYIKEFVKLNPR